VVSPVPSTWSVGRCMRKSHPLHLRPFFLLLVPNIHNFRCVSSIPHLALVTKPNIRAIITNKPYLDEQKKAASEPPMPKMEISKKYRWVAVVVGRCVSESKCDLSSLQRT
jgi:hypothetical protein